MRQQKRPYLAYLLRLWQVRNKGQADWRAAVENAHSGERQGFASLAELFNFLEGEIGQTAQSQPTPGAGDSGDGVSTPS